MLTAISPSLNFLTSASPSGIPNSPQILVARSWLAFPAKILILFPLLPYIEKTKPLPISISEPVLSGAATANGTNALTFTTTDSIPTVCDLTSFTDKEDMQRLGSYWTINEEGRVFFLRDYPYHKDNSVIATYVAGDNRVPSAIHEATTKLVAAEIIRMDDQSVLLAETGGNMSAKEKYDILRKEAMDTLKGKGDIVYFLD